jgi:hypothetical protein
LASQNSRIEETGFQPEIVPNVIIRPAGRGPLAGLLKTTTKPFSNIIITVETPAWFDIM